MQAIGATHIHLDATDSTNAHAARLLAAGTLGHGAVVTAGGQTAGRGQHGRVWRDEPGLDLLASIVLIPENMRAMEQFQVAKAAALAVRAAVAAPLIAAGRDASALRIKWPNDILVTDRKLAGILIENEIKGDRLASCIVGVGINVNSLVPDAGLKATSLLIETGRRQDLGELLHQLCSRMQFWWRQVCQGGATVAPAYLHALWARGRFTGFALNGTPFNARPLDVDDQGRLIVEDEDGRVAAYGLDRLRHSAR